MKVPERKDHSRFLLYRVAICLYLIAFVFYVSFGINALIPKYGIDPFLFSLMLTFAPICFLMFHLGKIKVAYCIFGPYKLTKPPGTPLRHHVSSQFAGVGWNHLRGLPTEFKFYGNGMSIKMFASKVIFLPYNVITGFKRSSFGVYKIQVNSPEFRNPVTLRDKDLIQLFHQEYSFWYEKISKI